MKSYKINFVCDEGGKVWGSKVPLKLVYLPDTTKYYADNRLKEKLLCKHTNRKEEILYSIIL